MKKFYIIIVFLIFGKIVAAPTVTVAPLSGVQDVNSTKSVVYFQVNFSEPVAGFTATDVVIYGSANPIKAFIKPKEKRIALPVNHSLQFFDFDEIIRIESESNYSHIFLMDKRKITLTKTLKEVEEKFVGQDFFMIHQSHFINLNHIDKIYKGENAYLVMKDGTQISISRHRKDEFLDLIKKI